VGECSQSVHSDYVKALAFASGAGKLVSGGLDNRMAVWDVSRGAITAAFNDEHKEVILAGLLTPAPENTHEPFTVDLFAGGRHGRYPCGLRLVRQGWPLFALHPKVLRNSIDWVS
jgi:hypothetical protein